MRIISFANAAMSPLWAMPAQALGPLISRIKHSLGHLRVVPSEDRACPNGAPTFGLDQCEASNESTFTSLHKATALSHKTASAVAARSLRIVRSSDTAITADCAGRMVISGRMADVCAELDRMAQRAGTVNKTEVWH